VSPFDRAQVVRIRAPRVMTAVRLVVWGLILVAGVAWIRRPDVRLHVGVVSVLGLGAGALAVITLAAQLFRPDGVDLQPDAAVVRGWFRRRTVPWHDVADVRLGAWGVVLVRTDGRRISLGYPATGVIPPFGLRRVQADHNRIREWWLARSDTG
jgi:hypothetical protein